MRKTIKNIGVVILAAAGTALAGDHYSNPQQAILQAATESSAQLHRELESGVDINATDDDHDTALMQAASEGNLTAVSNLIAAGANVNLQNEDAESALMMAAAEGYTEIVQALIAAGANTDAVDDDGETAYQKAKDDGHTATAEIIRRLGGQ